MGANKEKQNIRMKKVCERLNKKVTYDGLSKNQKEYIITRNKYNQVDKELNYFYRTCKRNESNNVDWDSLSESELDYFDYIYKNSQKLLNKMIRLSEKIDVEQTESTFLQINCNSVSF